MPKYIPVKAAKDIASEFDCKQIILLAWDGQLTHIITYGKTQEDCVQAANGGNMLKQEWGWPECNDEPSILKKLKNRIKELEEKLKSKD